MKHNLFISDCHIQAEIHTDLQTHADTLVHGNVCVLKMHTCFFLCLHTSDNYTKINICVRFLCTLRLSFMLWTMVFMVVLMSCVSYMVFVFWGLVQLWCFREETSKNVTAMPLSILPAFSLSVFTLFFNRPF